MGRAKIDWSSHVEAYRSSGQSLDAYCKDVGVKLSTLRHHIYKTKASQTPKPGSNFHEISFIKELVITRSSDGEVSIRGFGAEDLPALIQAWSDALQG